MTLPKVLPASPVSAPARKPLRLGQGRLPERVPVAVIDIGSNSVRQVIYEGQTRAPAVLFNEKILCGLGEGLHQSGRLNEIAVERALRALRRFRQLQHQTQVGDVHILATAAAREAENGPQFIQRVEELSGYHVEVLTGKMEAHYASLGIYAGFHKPSGIVGDLGGGSLELVNVNMDRDSGMTLPLGGLRLREMAGESLQKAAEIARRALSKSPVVWGNSARTFYAVGGTWRSVGRLHISNHDYPLATVHEYTIDADELARFCDKVASRELSEIRGIDAVSKNRRALLPYGAVVMRQVIDIYQPERIAVSSLGVREGFLYSRLSKKETGRDSLLTAARDLSILRARTPDHCLELADWTEMAFEKLGIAESEDERRHRIAACYLADIGWRAHPDFRARQALEVIANAGFVGISHEGRAYLAIASFHRYQGLAAKVGEPGVSVLASPETRRKARLLAAFFRVLYLLSASTAGILPHIGFTVSGDGKGEFTLPGDLRDLIGERPEERVRQLSVESGIELSLRITG
ncbi:MAG: Ppx/GppA family phosphatase [Nitratireductor sp.]|nr:Ppx/GppA family phosphatase [Nitratireductor sp.]